MAATYKDIREATGLSLATISKYFNGQNVRPENAAAISAAAKELDFHPNSFAQALRSKQSRTIGVLLPDLANTFHSTIVAYMANLLMEVGYGLIVATYGNEKGRLQQSVDFLLGKRIDGLVMVHGGDGGWPDGFTSEESGLPLVVLDRVDGRQVDSVTVDNFAAGKMAAHLLEKYPLERVALLAGPRSLSSLRGREDGFVSGLGKKVRVTRAPLEVEAARSATEALLEETPMPRALFTANAELTQGAIIALNEANLRIPEDVAIVGFDDPFLARTIPPGLTVITQPVDEIASEAARLVLRRIGNRQLPVEQTVLGCSIHLGASA